MIYTRIKNDITLPLSKAIFFGAFFIIMSCAVNAATILKIDENQGSFSIAPWYCTSNCNVEEQYLINGSFEMIFDTDFPFIERVRFNPLDIETTLSQEETFDFPTYPVKYENGEFSGNGDPCNFWNSSGSCSSIGNFGFFSGTFDGRKLEIAGSVAKDNSYSYHYNITATVVPLPSGALLFLSGLVAFTAIAKKKNYITKTQVDKLALNANIMYLHA